jgi:hypothetical protein
LQKDRIVSKRPEWSINRQAYSSSRCEYSTENGDNFGKKPYEYDLGNFTENKVHVGSTRVTNHLPGYTGFIPDIDVNILASK